MSGSFVKRFINSLCFYVFKFVLERGRPFGATYNRVNVNRHSVKVTSIEIVYFFSCCMKHFQAAIVMTT